MVSELDKYYFGILFVTSHCLSFSSIKMEVMHWERNCKIIAAYQQHKKCEFFPLWRKQLYNIHSQSLIFMLYVKQKGYCGTNEIILLMTTGALLHMGLCICRLVRVPMLPYTIVSDYNEHASVRNGAKTAGHHALCVMKHYSHDHNQNYLPFVLQ